MATIQWQCRANSGDLAGHTIRNLPEECYRSQFLRVVELNSFHAPTEPTFWAATKDDRASSRKRWNATKLLHEDRRFVGIACSDWTSVRGMNLINISEFHLAIFFFYEEYVTQKTCVRTFKK